MCSLIKIDVKRKRNGTGIICQLQNLTELQRGHQRTCMSSEFSAPIYFFPFFSRTICRKILQSQRDTLAWLMEQIKTPFMRRITRDQFFPKYVTVFSDSIVEAHFVSRYFSTESNEEFFMQCCMT